MSDIKRESHLRSLLKGLSWRFVATADTVLVVGLVTWLMLDKPGWEAAFKVAGFEFFLKYIVYYFHERVWEKYRTGTGLEKARTLRKSISWRIIATVMTLLLAGAIVKGGGWVWVTIAIVEFFSKFALYYLHERVWLMIPLGKIRQLVGKDDPDQQDENPDNSDKNDSTSDPQ